MSRKHETGRVCPYCDGTGQEKYKEDDFEWYAEYEQCNYCGGTGFLTDDIEEIDGENLRVFNPCDVCIARKERYTHKLCQECVGNPSFVEEGYEEL